LPQTAQIAEGKYDHPGWNTYVEELTGTEVIVPIKREGGGLADIKFRGVYDTSTPQHLNP
jgi:hypothetical protein